MKNISYGQLLEYLGFEQTEKNNLFFKYEKNNVQIAIFSDEENENKLTGYVLNYFRKISKKKLFFLYNDNLGVTSFTEEKNNILQKKKQDFVLEPIGIEKFLKFYFPLLSNETFFSIQDQNADYNFLTKKKFENVFFSKKESAFVFPFFNCKNHTNFLFYPLDKSKSYLSFEKSNEFYLTESLQNETKINIFFSLSSLILFENKEEKTNEYPDLLINQNFSKLFVFNLLELLIKKNEKLNVYKIIKSDKAETLKTTIKLVCCFHEYFKGDYQFEFSENKEFFTIHFNLLQEEKSLKLTTFFANLNKTLVAQFNMIFPDEEQPDQKYFFQFVKNKTAQRKILSLSSYKNFLYLNLLLSQLKEFLSLPNLEITKE